jgi:hypothetical protein
MDHLFSSFLWSWHAAVAPAVEKLFALTVVYAVQVEPVASLPMNPGFDHLLAPERGA